MIIQSITRSDGIALLKYGENNISICISNQLVIKIGKSKMDKGYSNVYVCEQCK